MQSTSVLGIVILTLVLCGIFAGLYFAAGAVGKAVEFAEEREIITPCSNDSGCRYGTCVDGYCRERANDSST